MAIWEYQNSETPEPIVTKLGTGDYVGDMTSTTQFKPIALVGASGKGVKYHSRVVLSFICDLNFWSCPETKPEYRFLPGLIHRCQSRVIVFLER